MTKNEMKEMIANSNNTFVLAAGIHRGEGRWEAEIIETKNIVCDVVHHLDDYMTVDEMKAFAEECGIAIADTDSSYAIGLIND